MRLRVLVVSADPVGRAMAGPGIRYRAFARELARRFAVTLAIPNEPEEELPGVRVVGGGDVAALAADHDVAVVQRLDVPTLRRLVRARIPVVHDLYVPVPVETLPYLAEGGAAAEAAYREVVSATDVALATGAAFVCASERQRDLWLGALAAHGRLDVARYRRDPTLRGLIDVVPFGVEAEAPRATRRVLRGVVPGIGEGDRVLLWAGGIWNWFDPLTVIRAVARLDERRGDVRLVFLGRGHPSAEVPQMAMERRAVELARSLGVEGRSVFFGDRWVAYDERQDYLLEAELGVSAHREGAEARFAFRTRLVDHFWAGLPTVCTGGDVLGDLVAERGLGRAVAPGDVDGWVEALGGLLDDADARARAREACAAVADELRWPRVVEALARLVEGAAGKPAGRRAADLPSARWAWRGVRASVARRGVPATARAILGRSS